jgi:hypothetical protein
VQIRRCANVQIGKIRQCANEGNVQNRRCANVQIGKIRQCANEGDVQIRRCANMQMGICVNEMMCKCADELRG